METKAHSEVTVAVPFEELWGYADEALKTLRWELLKAQEESPKSSVRRFARRVTVTVERFDRYRQEIQYIIAVRFLTRTMIPLQANLEVIDDATTRVQCSVEIQFRGFRGWLLKQGYNYALKHYEKSTLQEGLDAAMRDWAKSLETTYQRFGNLSLVNVSETSKEMQKEQPTWQKQS